MPVTDNSAFNGIFGRNGCAVGGAQPNNTDTIKTESALSISNTVRYRAAVICASDRCFQGMRQDASSPIITEILTSRGYEITAAVLLPDDYEMLRAAMVRIADEGTADLIITTGGTGLAPCDITPEATAAIIERSVPGIPEAMRTESMKITPHGMLSRGIAGIRKRTLIINLPGSPKAAKENLSCILPALDHALLMLTGGTQDCAKA